MSTTPSSLPIIQHSRSTRLWSGAVLRLLRQRRGWTQCSLATTMGVSDTTWSRFEQGTLPIPQELVRRVEECFEIPFGYLHSCGAHLSQHFQGVAGTAAWRFRKTKEMLEGPGTGARPTTQANRLSAK